MAYIDFQQRASEFAVGDIVYPFLTGNPGLNGRVMAVYPAIGMVDVEWPHGSERVPVEDLQQYFNQAGDFNPSNVGHDNIPGGAGTVSVPGGPEVPVDQEPLKKRGAVGATPKQVHLLQVLFPPKRMTQETPVQIPELLEQLHGTSWARVTPRGTVILTPFGKQNLWASTRFTASRVAKAFVKQSLYWAARDRKYKASQEEIDTGNFRCPRCKEIFLRPASYKRENGTNVRLLACNECLFLIKPCDIKGHPDNLVDAEGDILAAGG